MLYAVTTAEERAAARPYGWECIGAEKGWGETEELWRFQDETMEIHVNLSLVEGERLLSLDDITSLLGKSLMPVIQLASILGIDAAPASQLDPALTVNGLVEMAYGTAKAAGWHDRKGEVLDPDHPYARIAVLAPFVLRLADVIEAIRKPEKLSISEAIGQLRGETTFLGDWGVSGAIALRTFIDLGEAAQGSKAEVLAWLMLIISEAAEAIEAVINGDKANFAEELVADIPLRIGDLVGSINDTQGHPMGPIDPEATILAKNERNRQRGYRHGGKRA